MRPQIDVSGPLNDSRTILYRLNSAIERSQSYFDYDTEIKRLFLAPSLTFRLGDRTDLTVSLEYLDDQRPTDFGLFAVGDRIVGEPDDKESSERFRVGYDLEHRFSQQWTLRNAFRYIFSEFADTP